MPNPLANPYPYPHERSGGQDRVQGREGLISGANFSTPHVNPGPIHRVMMSGCGEKGQWGDVVCVCE